MNRLPTLTHPLKVNHWFTKPIGDRTPRLITYLPSSRRFERPDYAEWNGAALHAIDACQRDNGVPYQIRSA